MRSTGQTSWRSTFQVRSPQSRKSNGPSRKIRARLRALSEVSSGRSAGRSSQAGFSGAAPRLQLDHLAAPGEDQGRQVPLQRQRVAGAEHGPLPLAGLQIGDEQGVIRLRAVGEVEAGDLVGGQAAVPEAADLDPLRQPLDPAEVVAVPVGRHQVVEPVEPGHLLQAHARSASGRGRRSRPSRCRSGSTRHRASRSGSPRPQHVDEVDVEPRVLGRRGGRGRQEEGGSESDAPSRCGSGSSAAVSAGEATDRFHDRRLWDADRGRSSGRRPRPASSPAGSAPSRRAPSRTPPGSGARRRGPRSAPRPGRRRSGPPPGRRA